MFSQMAQTPEVAIFFGCITLMLAGMTVWEVAHPMVEYKGFLPITTTRGDRLFIGLLTTAHINLVWVELTLEETNAWGGFIASMMVLIIAVWRG